MAEPPPGGGMMWRLDASRALLRLTGADLRPFLQGLVTNDVDRLAPDAPVYAAILSPQGKYLFDFFLLDPGDGSVLLDVAADRRAALGQRLTMYRLRSDVGIAAEDGLEVACLWGGEPAPDIPGALAVADPRAAALGWRIYAAPGAASRPFEAAPASEADRTALRIACMAPETGLELTPDETYILEAGFERLNGVDFRKGCYVGQEVTARMKHKTELRKGLARVAVEGDPPPPGAEILTEDGKSAGALHSTAEGFGLAHLRFDRARGAVLTAGAARIRLTD